MLRMQLSRNEESYAKLTMSAAVDGETVASKKLTKASKAARAKSRDVHAASFRRLFAFHLIIRLSVTRSELISAFSYYPSFSEGEREEGRRKSPYLHVSHDSAVRIHSLNLISARIIAVRPR